MISDHEPISADDLAAALDRYRQHQPTALHAVGLAVLCERALVTLRHLDDIDASGEGGGVEGNCKAIEALVVERDTWKYRYEALVAALEATP